MKIQTSCCQVSPPQFPLLLIFLFTLISGPVTARSFPVREPAIQSLHSKPGWPLRGIIPDEIAVLHDLDGDGSQEIIFTGWAGEERGRRKMFVLRGDGTPLKGWPQEIGMVRSSGPVVGDVNGDGSDEVVTTDGRRVMVWNKKGRLLGSPGAALPGMNAAMHSDAGAALGDVDGDGILELVFGVWGPQVAAVRLKSSPEQLPGFPVAINGVVGGSPALADIDSDGRDEIIVANESGALYFIDALKEGAKVTVATDQGGEPLAIRARSSPSVGHFGEEGSPMILIGSYRGNLHALDASGRQLWTFPTRGNMHCTPALADMDGDGRLEIAFTSYDGLIRIVRDDGTILPGWENVNLGGKLGSGIAAGDTDGDGRPELVVTVGERILILNERGNILASVPGGQSLLGDVDGDGLLDLVAMQFAEGVDCKKLPAKTAPPPSWPMNRFNGSRTGYLPK